MYNIENGYAVLKRSWKKNDIVEMNLPMEVRQVVANEKVRNDIGKMALQRGPVMYCAEWIDNNGKAANIIMPADTKFTTTYKADLLNGIEILKANVPVVLIEANGEALRTEKQPFIAIPYYAWANRGKGEMMLWFPERVKDVELFSDE